MARINTTKLVNQLINNLRRGNCHNDYLGKRFVIDCNIHFITMCAGDSNTFIQGITIGKLNGKYKITKWESEAVDGGFIDHKSVRVISDYRIVVNLINEWNEYAETVFIRDRHHKVSWHVYSEPEEDCGELPEGFEKLENIPEEIVV